MSNVVSLFSKLEWDWKKWLQEVGWGLYSLARGMAKRIQLLLDIVELQDPDNKKSNPIRIVRWRTIKRIMKSLGRRWEKLESKITELREDEEHFHLAVKIFIFLVMLKKENWSPGATVPEERILKITDTKPFKGYELDAIIAILENFWLNRGEISKTIRWETAKSIRKIDFDDVYTFLKWLHL
jgi:hypothetical protein